LSNVAAKLSEGDYRVTVTQCRERELALLVAHHDNAFSDENFVMRPRQMFRQIEENVGRIELIEGIARCLWAPFRPAFHVVVSNPALDPVRQVLEMTVREILARTGWEQAVVFQACGEECKFADINFAQVSELVLRRDRAPTALSVQVATLKETVAVLSETRTAEVLSICEQIEALVNDRCVVGTALAS
jgi:hypothetical protein